MASKVKEAHLHYLVYGQRLCSNLPLPQLPRARFDVRDMAFSSVSFNGTAGLPSLPGRLLSRRTTNLGCDLSIHDTGDGFLLRWEGCCDFLVSVDGRHVQCYPGPDVGAGWVQSTLYGVVLSFALHLLKVGNLHASAVVLPQGAVGFLAEPGVGKSTLAGIFASHGYPFLTDDVLALKESGPGYMAHPGFPFVSLALHSAGPLLGSAGCRPPGIFLNGEKQRLAIDGKWALFCPQPVPLRGLFLLARSPEESTIEVELLPRLKAIGGLLENTNCLPLLPAEAVRRQLAFVTSLAASVPVWRLSYPSGFQHASMIVGKVLQRTVHESM